MSNKEMPIVHVRLIPDDAHARSELRSVGVDPQSESIMAPKLRHLVIKIKDLDVRAANILKQEMLAKGADAAVAKWASGFTQPTTDVLLMGTVKQYRQVLKKLRIQPYGLQSLAEPISRLIESDGSIKAVIGRPGHELIVGERTLVMGILNLTPDSFSDGGLFLEPAAAVERASEMAANGADIIDIGGESTRPGADPVSEDEEKRRVLPVIERLASELDVPLSIDTSKAGVAGGAIEAGAQVVNDVTALRADPDMARVCAQTGVAVILMHMQGEPREMQEDPRYDDILSDLVAFFAQRLSFAAAAGIAAERSLIDPGFGFGKTTAHNLEILNRLGELRSLGHPIVLGTSRKSTIGTVLGNAPAGERLEGTAATVAAGILGGASIIRVHDVKEMARVAAMTDAIMAGEAWHG